jgi:hypothetical protein
MGIIDLKDKVVDLLLEKLNDRVALSDHCIILIDLVLPVKNVSSLVAIISSSVTKA